MRPHREEDAFLLNQAVLESFEQLHEWMEWAAHPPTLDQTKAYIRFAQECWTKENPIELPLLIFDAEEKNLIGSSGYHAINWSVPCFETGYWVNKKYSGQGFITEAVNILTRHAFTNLKAKRLEIRCDSENVRSAQVPMRLGYDLEAHFKNNRVQPASRQVSGTFIYVRYGIEVLPNIQYDFIP